MWSIAAKTLLADRGKLVTAFLGVVFSVVLVNVQGGLFLGLIRKVSLLVDYGDADIWVGHRDIHNVDMVQDIPAHWVDRLRGIEGVAAAEPFLVGWANMTLPDGGFEAIVVMGCDPASLMGNAWSMSRGSPEDVRRPDGIIVDEYELGKLGHPEIGDVREINGRRARVVAMSRGIVGFLVAPYVFTTLERAGAYLNKPPDVCSYFLVELEPGADAERVCRFIRERAPDLDAYPRETYSRMSVDFWLTRTGLGISFGAATLIGLVVGLVMVAQTLYASVLDRVGEFGALKAMGAEERHLYRLLFVQAVIMAGIGSLAGLGIVAVIQWFFSTPHAPIVVPAWLAFGSCAAVLVICLISSILPYLRVRSIDPVTVLQG